MAAQRSNGVTFVPFAPARLGLRVSVVSGATVRTSGPPAGVLAALDGPMFAAIGSGRARIKYRHYDQDAGVDLPTTDPSGLTVSVVDGAAVVRDGATVVRGAKVAVQLYPSLVRGGAVVARADINRERVWRAALCVLRDGRLAFAVAVGSMVAFARALADLGAVDAGYTDGGSSTRLQTDGDAYGSSRPRAVASWLVVRSGVASRGGPSTGGGGAIAAGLLLALAGIALWRAST